MAEGVNGSRSNQMTIIVKTPKEKHDIHIGVKATVKELKEEVAKQFGSPEEQLCLIFAGKILKDPDTLEQHGIKHGLTVHLVIKTTSRPAEPVSPSPTQTTGPVQPDVSQTPFGLGSLGGLAGISSLGMGSANFMDMQQRMERELMGNPAMLHQMMENPFVQQIMSNPDIMRQLVMNNPQMRELMERNPEITHMLNNPDLMRQTMELARNPAMLQELMRSQDRAMSNLESLPGGFSALQRMYQDIQEPMMNAAQDTLGSNPFASNTSSGSASVFNSPGMQSLVQQMMQNPQMMQNMMQAPYMQSMLEHLNSNHQLARQVLSHNPMFADNPALMERFQAILPTVTAQLNNPDVHAAMSNPRAMDAIMQIQQGMQTLQSEAPQFFVGLSGLQGAPAHAPGTTTTTTTTSDTTTTGNTTGSTLASPMSTTAGNTSQGSEAFSNMMSQLMGMMVGGQANQSPEQRYASQLEQLATMGFMDRDANIRALTATLGDVNAAIDRLLQQR